MNKIEALSNLTPETLLGIEDCSFADAVMALPGVVSASESIGEVEFVGRDDIGEHDEIDVNGQLRMDPSCEERMVVMDRYVVAGGLYNDSDSQNPMEEGSANGSIYHRGRRASGNEEACFYETTGMDGDGEKDLNSDAVSDALSDRCEILLRKNKSIMMTLCNLMRDRSQVVTWQMVFDRISEAVLQEGWEYAMDYIADYFFGERYWHNVDEKYHQSLDALSDMFSLSEAERAWGDAVSAGKLGNPLAVLVDIYEHSGVSYSVSGSGSQCRWDTTRAGAVWVPCDNAEENIRSKVLSNLGVGEVKWFGNIGGPEGDTLNARFSLDGENWVGEGMGWKWKQALDAMIEASGVVVCRDDLARLMATEAEAYCKGVLEEYSSWANGDVYGVCYYVIDRNTGKRIEEKDEECWGFIGSKYAEKELENGILSLVAHLGQTVH